MYIFVGQGWYGVLHTALPFHDYQFVFLASSPTKPNPGLDLAQMIAYLRVCLPTSLPTQAFAYLPVRLSRVHLPNT